MQTPIARLGPGRGYTRPLAGSTRGVDWPGYVVASVVIGIVSIAVGLWVLTVTLGALEAAGVCALVVGSFALLVGVTDRRPLHAELLGQGGRDPDREDQPEHEHDRRDQQRLGQNPQDASHG